MRKSKRPKWRGNTQLSLVHRKNACDRRGGTRPGAGRPKKPGAVSHDSRPVLKSRFPQHVTLRVDRGVPTLATLVLMKIIREVIRESHKERFRIVEFNVLANHLHLITEAASNGAMSRGIQGFKVRLVHRLNSALKRSGSMFPDRFHARYLKTPTEVRHCLRYVLLNRKHHAAEQKFAKNWIDPFSSAPWFDGWTAKVIAIEGWPENLVAYDRPTASPETWLLRVGWRQCGLLALDERPA
jgi:REP element-mobilizing transposase RayT